MSADRHTATEDAAGRYARSEAWQQDDREHDELGLPVEHDCTSPNPERCLLCVLDKVVAEQKVARA